MAFLVGSLSGGAAGIYAPQLAERGWFEPWITRTTMRETASAVPESVDEHRITDIVGRALPSVVSINITKEISRSDFRFDGLEEFYDDPFYSFPVPEQLPEREESLERLQIGGGSGFFVTEDGIIATNRHVIDDEDAEYTVVTVDGRELDAVVLAKDPVLDLAFLKVEGERFPALALADSDGIQIGETVIAIGNALAEFSHSVTKGIVSGKNRRLLAGGLLRSEIIEEAIQTDAAINPGNSGGPLINMDGEVIGMNTAISDGAQLLGFALPSNSLQRSLDSVREYGRVVRPWLGVRFVPVDADYARSHDLAHDYGAHIIAGTEENPSIIPDSPAARAGLREGDVILEIDGVRVDDEHSLANIVSKRFPDEEVTLRVARGSETMTLKAVLEERDPNF